MKIKYLAAVGVLILLSLSTSASAAGMSTAVEWALIRLGIFSEAATFSRPALEIAETRVPIWRSPVSENRMSLSRGLSISLEDEAALLHGNSIEQQLTRLLKTMDAVKAEEEADDLFSLDTRPQRRRRTLTADPAAAKSESTSPEGLASDPMQREKATLSYKSA